MNIIVLILRFCRASFIPVTIFPVIAGIVFALRINRNAGIDIISLIMLVFASIMIHLLANGINDYFDFKEGLETLIKVELDQKQGDTQGGSKLLTDGIITLRQAKNILLILLTAIIASGLYLLINVDYRLIYFGIAGIMLGFFYTAPPLRLSYRGFGETVIFVCFGILPFYAGYYFINREIAWMLLLPASVFGLLTVLILYFHHFGHWKQDRKIGKRNIIVIIGIKWGIRLFVLILLAIILLIIINVYCGIFNIFSLALILPLLILIHRSFSLDLNNYDNIQKYLRDIILTNFISSAVLIFSLAVKSSY